MVALFTVLSLFFYESVPGIFVPRKLTSEPKDFFLCSWQAARQGISSVEILTLLFCFYLFANYSLYMNLSRVAVLAVWTSRWFKKCVWINGRFKEPSCVSVTERATWFVPLGLGLGLDTFWSWSRGGLWHWTENDFKKLVVIKSSSSSATNTSYLSC